MKETSAAALNNATVPGGTGIARGPTLTGGIITMDKLTRMESRGIIGKAATTHWNQQTWRSDPND